MTLLPTTDLTWMRAEQERAMPGTPIYVLRAGTASDGMGGYTETWGTVGTVTGRISLQNQRSVAEGVGGAQVISETRWFYTGPVGTDITEKDRLGYQGRTWEVTKTNTDQDYQTALRCELVAHNEESRV